MTDLALRAFQIFITLVYSIREKLGAEPQNYRVIQVVYRVGILNIGYAICTYTCIGIEHDGK